MGTHALLAPSAASKWFNCPPSARLEEQTVNSSSSYADEGTTAHDLAQLILKAKLGIIGTIEYGSELVKIEANRYYNAEMWEHCENYAGYCLELFTLAKKTCKDAQIFIEVKLDLTKWIPDSFGTSDCVIVADGTMYIIDLKYGKGVPVSALNNKQMMVYALGALGFFDFLYEIKEVNMSIFQPRRDSISDFTISTSALLFWAEDELKPVAELAYHGEGSFKAGDHCKFCRIKNECRAHTEWLQELTYLEFKDPVLLSDYEIAALLHKADSVVEWYNGLIEWALTQAVNDNKKWPGFKLVEGRSNRKILNEDEAIGKLFQEGYLEYQIMNSKLKGIGDLEKLLTKSKFAKLLGELTVKPPGKPTLVTEEDKRPEISSLEKAIQDFL